MMLKVGKKGFTLIELMVSITIGMILLLSVFTVLTSAESNKRTMASVNDINQSGNYAMYQIEQWVRSAGYGFSRAANYAYGCTLYASKNNTQVLPISSAPPVPFTHVTIGTTGVFRLAPVLILPDATTPGTSGSASDVLIVMKGNAGTTAIPTSLKSTPPISADTLPMINTVGFNKNDIVLIADSQQIIFFIKT